MDDTRRIEALEKELLEKDIQILIAQGEVRILRSLLVEFLHAARTPISDLRLHLSLREAKLKKGDVEAYERYERIAKSSVENFDDFAREVQVAFFDGAMPLSRVLELPVRLITSRLETEVNWEAGTKHLLVNFPEAVLIFWYLYSYFAASQAGSKGSSEKGNVLHIDISSDADTVEIQFAFGTVEGLFGVNDRFGIAEEYAKKTLSPEVKELHLARRLVETCGGDLFIKRLEDRTLVNVRLPQWTERDD
jgi:hypothetical protein